MHESTSRDVEAALIYRYFFAAIIPLVLHLTLCIYPVPGFNSISPSRCGLIYSESVRDIIAVTYPSRAGRLPSLYFHDTGIVR
jgi:hypothetical protein